MTIGDLLFALGIDGSRLEQDVTKEAQKAGDAGASTMTKRLSLGLKAGAAAIGTAVAGMFAFALKGSAELTSIENDFQSETGASAEEAKRAGQVINKVAGENQLSLEAVRDAAIAVHKDLGLTGDAADKATAQFAKFGRVTKQEPAAAVKAFDDILDAWNLTADDTQTVMDALVVSGQKYGGSVEDDQAALAKLAPVLTAVNGTWQDGIALLDLAKASGLDTADAITGLNKALGKVKSPEELQRLIDDISNTADPFLRAQKAADLFGQKAGPKLANALAGKSLKDFRIDMNEAAGATDKAADALDQGFGGQARKMLSEFGATLRGLGSDWGPVLTGAAGFATLFASLGLDTVIEKLGPKAIAAFKDVGTKGGQALVDAAGTATGALGTIIGNNISNRIEAIFAPGQTALGKVWRRMAGSRVVLAATAAAGAASGAVYAAFAAAVEPLVTAMRGAWTALTGSPSFVASVRAAGASAGGTFAAAATAAILAAPVVVTWVLVQQGENDQKNTNDARQAAIDQIAQVGEERAKLVADIAQLQQLANLQKGNTEGVGGFIMGLFGDPAKEKALYDQTVNQLNQLKALLASQDDAMRHLNTGDSAELGTTIAAQAAQGVTAGTPKVTKATVSMVDDATAAAGYAANKKAFELGQALPDNTAAGIRSRRQAVFDAFDQLKEDIKNALNPKKEQVKLIGELFSKELANGLRNGDPVVRAQAREARTAALNELQSLIDSGAPIGKKTTDALAKGLRSRDPKVRETARQLAKIIDGRFDAAAGPAHSSGVAAGNAFANGVRAAITARMQAGINIHVNAIYNDNGHGNAVGGWATAGVPTWVNEHTTNSEIFVPSTSGRFLTHAEAMNALHQGGGAPINITVNAGGDVSPVAAHRFGQLVVHEVAAAFRQGGARRGISTSVRP
jgi:phage-related minor tail protein